MIRADYHMHTHHSGDSDAPMEDMIKSAIDRGLSSICITEHQDLDYPDIYDVPADKFTLDTDAYQKELFYYKEKYSDRINIQFGVEIGMQPQIVSENRDYVHSYPFDFIIASEHLVDKEDPYYPVFWDTVSHESAYNRFFDQTYENLTLFDDYDVLGHLDYINRYEPGEKNTYSYGLYKEKIDRILRHIIAHDKGLDLNTKVLSSNPQGMTNPHPDVLSRYRELGGRIITFGSDAHSPQNVGCGFERAREIALSCGFTEYFTFEKRTPTAHRL